MGNIKDIIKKAAGLTSGTTVGLGNEINRSEWLRNVLQQVPAGSRLLDAGAGEQPYRPFCSHLHYVSQDIGEYDGKGEVGLQTERWDFGKLDIVSDIASIPEPDGAFDAILCSEVIEHIPDPVRVFGEFSRLLRPGGHLILTAPFCSLTHFAPNHFCTGFSRFFYEYHLDANGFELSELSYNGNYFGYLAQELLRLNSVAQKYTASPLSRSERIRINKLLKTIERLDGADSGSRELLCYGIHIHARKR
ncbi:class I SAM-dependent methyltransferase [Mucilaginibacter ginsenosidivorans]|uniref:Methyltransferase domain-containing protein n=1 Tax=Mucilaginibacter ginsenosidivorans TaxID=398053 RepID=A0A5B8UW54_9SPHI|nr:class I SAM-dependent methyltransferase [Mucilaginibacter ginsenosidivorans]QEC62561.1 methyltransferase domain-containing protein [Mucilaginibacter ginsenosidivorans]